MCGNDHDPAAGNGPTFEGGEVHDRFAASLAAYIEFHILRGSEDVERRTSGVRASTLRVLHALDDVVVVRRIVVEQCKPGYTRFHGNVAHIVCWTVAPSQFGEVFFARILSVMNHEISASQEVNVPLIAGMMKRAPGRVPERFVIRYVSDRRPIR